MKAPIPLFPKLATSTSAKAKAAPETKPETRFEDVLSKAMTGTAPPPTRTAKPKDSREPKLKVAARTAAPEENRPSDNAPSLGLLKNTATQTPAGKAAPSPEDNPLKPASPKKATNVRGTSAPRASFSEESPKELAAGRRPASKKGPDAEQSTGQLSAQALPVFAKTHPLERVHTESIPTKQEPGPTATPTVALSPAAEPSPSNRSADPPTSQPANLVQSAPPNFEAAASASAPVQVLAASLPPPAVDDPSLRVWLSNGVSQLQVEGADGTPMRLKVRSREGVMDLLVSGSSAPQFIQRENELRMVLAQEGLTLGQLDLSQQGQGSSQQDRWQAAQESSERPIPAAPPGRREETVTLHTAHHLNVKA